MEYFAYIISIIFGIGLIREGIRDLKKNNWKSEGLHTEYRLIYFGVIMIILVLLGIFGFVPWEK